jgi:hypothetical protein
VRRLVAAIRENDEDKVEEAVLQLARTRRIFAPLALAVGAFVMLFNGLRLLVTNWRLMLVQALPLFPLGVALLIIGLMLEAGATGAVKAIKVSAKLLAGQSPQTPAERA